jgi:hypothetical protein
MKRRGPEVINNTRGTLSSLCLLHGRMERSLHVVPDPYNSFQYKKCMQDVSAGNYHTSGEG